MEKLNIVKPPGTLTELQETARNEPMERRGAKAIIENYAKRNDMTYEEAAKALGYKNAAPIASMAGRGVLESDGNGGVTDESVESYKKKKSSKKWPRYSAEKITTDDDAKFIVNEEPIQKPLDDVTREDDDSTIIVTTKGELKEAFRRWLHSQKRVTVEEILDIVA